MKSGILARPVIVIGALVVFALVVIDLAPVARPSVLAAIGCTTALVTSTPEAMDSIAQFADQIRSESERNDLPAELVAAVIVNHQVGMSSWRRFTDCAGSALGANVSLGLAQLRLSTAALLDGMEFESMSVAEFRQLRAALLDAPSNIAYQARELRALLERAHRYPGLNADDLIRDPFVMALLISEYRSGRRASASEDSRLNANAFNALRILGNRTLPEFGRSADEIREIRRSVSQYLAYIYCDSGIFNASVCEDWMRTQNDTGNEASGDATQG